MVNSEQMKAAGEEAERVAARFRVSEARRKFSTAALIAGWLLLLAWGATDIEWIGRLCQ